MPYFILFPCLIMVGGRVFTSLSRRADVQDREGNRGREGGRGGGRGEGRERGKDEGSIPHSGRVPHSLSFSFIFKPLNKVKLYDLVQPQYDQFINALHYKTIFQIIDAVRFLPSFISPSLPLFSLPSSLPPSLPSPSPLPSHLPFFLFPFLPPFLPLAPFSLCSFPVFPSPPSLTSFRVFVLICIYIYIIFNYIYIILTSKRIPSGLS